MATLDRIVSLSAFLIVIHSSLGREPIPFVCTNRAKIKGDDQTPRDTVGHNTLGNMGSSSPFEINTGSSSFSEGISKQPTFPDGTTGPFQPFKGESGSSSKSVGTNVSSSSPSGTTQSCQSCGSNIATSTLFIGDTQTPFITTGQTPHGTNGSSSPSKSKNGSSVPAESTDNLSDGTTGPSAASENETKLALSSEGLTESYSSSEAITDTATLYGDTNTQSSTTGQTPASTNGSSTPLEVQNGSSAESTNDVSDSTTGPFTSSFSKDAAEFSLSSKRPNESSLSSEANTGDTQTQSLITGQTPPRTNGPYVPSEGQIGSSSPAKRTNKLFDVTIGPSKSSENKTVSSPQGSKESSTSSASITGDIKYPSRTIGHTPNATTFTSAHSEGKTGPYLSSEGTSKSSLPFDNTKGISTPFKGETDLAPSYEGFSSSASSETITARRRPHSSPGIEDDIPGKYIFTFLDLKCDYPSTTEIFIGTKFSDVGASGNIYFPLIDVPKITFSLLPGSGEIFNVSLIAAPNEFQLNQKVNTAIEIASDEEVVVYGHQRCYGSNNHRATAFRVRGIEDLGTEYWVVTHQSNGTSQVGVVATKNYTNVGISGVYINKTLSLNKYETFYFGGPYDLTGTCIVANKPILVIAGNSGDISPYSNIYEGTDSFYKCLPPVKDWGRHYTLVPFSPDSQPFTAKILSSHDNCTLECVNGTGDRILVSLSKGEVKNLISFSLLTIISSEGILVAQFSKGKQGQGLLCNPSMLLTPPYGDAGRNEFIFPVFKLSENNGGETSSITIWLPRTSDILLDNEIVSGDTIGADINGYDIVRIALSSPGAHIIHSSKNITAVVNGVGMHKYYSYSLR